MAITYPLSLPAGLARVTMRPLSVVAALRAPHSLKQNVEAFAGQAWQVEVEWPIMKRAAAAPITGFILSLNGMEGTVLLGDPAAITPLGAATGTPLVDGAAQTGGTLATKGWSNSITGILKAGDYISLGSGVTTRLHQVLADANSDGSGDASLDIWPDLRESPADSAAITTASPLGAFRLASNEPVWLTDAEGFYDIALSFVEAVDG